MNKIIEQCLKYDPLFFMWVGLFITALFTILSYWFIRYTNRIDAEWAEKNPPEKEKFPSFKKLQGEENER